MYKGFVFFERTVQAQNALLGFPMKDQLEHERDEISKIRDRSDTRNRTLRVAAVLLFSNDPTGTPQLVLRYITFYTNGPRTLVALI